MSLVDKTKTPYPPEFAKTDLLNHCAWVTVRKQSVSKNGQ
jgi:hypothetical protein